MNRFLRALLNDGYRLWLLAGMLLYCLIFTGLAWDLHAGMRTHRSDLGQIDQAVWNSSRGRFVEQTDNGYLATRMTDHVEPILALISPIFWLWDDVRALLLLQVVAVAFGAGLLYELARLKLDQLLSTAAREQIWQVEPLQQLTRPLALTLATAYLLTPHLQSALLTEFHAGPLAVPLVLWAFYAVEKRRWWQFAGATLLVALVKEEMALLAAGLACWAGWRTLLAARTPPSPHPPTARFTYLLFGALFLCSLAWFYLATFVIVPAHALDVYGVAESGYFARYGALGNSPLDILRSFITQPGLVWQIATEPARLDYLFRLLLPFGFFSLLAPEILLLALPLLLANVLSAYGAQYYGEFHYSAPLVPYVAVSAAYGLGRVWRWWGRRTGNTSFGFQHLPAANAGMMALISLVRNARTTVRPLLAFGLALWLIGCGVAAYGSMGRGPLGGRYDPTPITAHHQLLARFKPQIPADAALTATAAVHPHFSHRRYIYQFPLGLDAPTPADWALLDVTTNTDMAPGDLKATVDAMLAADWGVVDAADGFLLLQRGAANKTIPALFYEFARGAASATLSDESIQVATLAINDWPRWRQTQLTTQWVVGSGFDPGTIPQFQVLAGDRTPLYTYETLAPPALIWYPPAYWQAGEVIRITTPTLYLPRLWQATVGPDGRLARVGWRAADGTTRVLYPPTRHLEEPIPSRSAHFRLVTSGEGEQEIRLRGQLLSTSARPGEAVALWLQWHDLAAWPEGWSVFVHLRSAAAVTLAQHDGPPLPQPDSPFYDARSLLVPPETAVGSAINVVVGLYEPQSGQRAELILPNGDGDQGNEFRVSELIVEPPRSPDQACALITATCASQP